MTATKYYKSEKLSLSKEHTNRLSNLLKITDLEEFSKNLNGYFSSEESDSSDSIDRSYHSYIWLKLGEKLNQSVRKLEQNEQDRAHIFYEYARQAFTNALDVNCDNRSIPRILCGRAAALKGLRSWSESKKDFENALSEDNNCEGSLYQNSFRFALDSLAEIEFTAAIGFRNIQNFGALEKIAMRYFDCWEEELLKKFITLKK